MVYHLYMYKTDARTEDAPVIAMINETLRVATAEKWKSNQTGHDLKPFNVEKIMDQIKNIFDDQCVMSVRYSPTDQGATPYLFIGTSYKMASKILPAINAIAARNSLVLFDAELNKYYFNQFVDNGLITIRIREKELSKAIRNNMPAVFHLFKMADYDDDGIWYADYAVSLRKQPDLSLIEQIKDIYRFLQQVIAYNEKLICKDKSFYFIGGGYQISFSFEAYKKSANMITYMDPLYDRALPKADLIHRMGAYSANRWLKNCDESEKRVIQRRMGFKEMIERFPNPADRFVHSINIEKHLKNDAFDIYYGCGGEISFYMESDFFKDVKNTSVLGFSEETASFILPFIMDVYPYIYDRYYETNYIPSQMLKDIVKRISEAREMVLHDPYNPELKPYCERFVWIFKNEPKTKCIKPKSKPYLQRDNSDILFEYRHQVAHIMDVFIRWANLQIEYFGWDDTFFLKIVGP